MTRNSLRPSTGRAALLERVDSRGPHRRNRGIPPGPALDLERGLVHQHPEPVDDGRTLVAGAAEQGGLERVVDEIGQHLARVERRRAGRGARPGRRAAIPTGVALTTSVAAAAACGPVVPGRTRARPRDRPRPPPPRAGARRPRRGRRQRPSASATARAAPPAPSSTTSAPAGSCPASRSERRNPSPSVESPNSRSSVSRRIVLTLCSAAASGESSSHTAGGRGLVRHRHREAGEPERRASPPARRASRRRAPRTRRRPSRGRAVRTRCCASTGDNECRTGSPMMPAILVAPEIVKMRRSAWRSRCSRSVVRASSRTRCRPSCRSPRSTGTACRRAASAAFNDAALTAAIGVGGNPVCV